MVDWLRTFWPLSQLQKFPQICDLCRNTANNISFHYRTNSVKNNDKFCNKLKKPCFWSVFGSFSQFFGQKFFSEISIYITHNFIWIFRAMPKFRKNLSYNSKKTSIQAEGRTEGRTLFHRIIPSTVGGSKRTHTQLVEYDVLQPTTAGILDPVS